MEALAIEMSAFPFNIIKLDGTQSPPPQKKKTQQQCVFPEIMTQLLKIIYRPCSEQFNLGIILVLQNYDATSLL